MLPEGCERFIMINMEFPSLGSLGSRAMNRSRPGCAGILAALICCWASTAPAGPMIVPTLAQPAMIRSEIHTLPTMSSPLGEAMTSLDGDWPADMPSAVRQIASQCQTGTLLFSAGDCLAVRAYTGSRYTHVATVVVSGEETWIYDSMNGAGVRKLLLEDYLEIQAPDEVTLFHPGRPFTAEEAHSYHTALERELGRPYSVKHFVTGKRCEGLHCAEYVTDALIEIDWLRAEHPAHVSPASLLEGVSRKGAYCPGGRVNVPLPLEPIPEPDGWCARAWQNTVLCVDGGCVQLSRWFLCR
jgi:hypothetical protein